ncbi:MAG TPA: apolipoprotein N-acyltransferase [Pyrinomonadaceae bacterium]|nr:apolipoprotein N-acyltransferase [Pyrinomonadaceae bacterium]
MEQAAEPAQISRAKFWGLGLLSLILLVLAFPNFDLWFLAWIGLAPLLLALARQPKPLQAFLVGWFVGAIFFYATCYWLTYSMIHYGGLSAWVAYPLLFPGAAVLGLFPATFALLQRRLIRVLGPTSLFAAPFIWVTFEWLRLSITGQLWNAIGYSQAFHPGVIQPARWGGVYAVSFILVAINGVIAFALLKRTAKALILASAIIAGVALILVNMKFLVDFDEPHLGSDGSGTLVVALQPNVPMDFDKTDEQLAALLNFHINESEKALAPFVNSTKPRLVIWPESPMNFTYGSDPLLQERLARFTRDNHTSLLFNSQESSPQGGIYNSALLINEEGRLVAQYDKIRLMPFGEYVPLPGWLPGANRVSAIVGGFEAGSRYTLMIGSGARMGTFICIESAYPWVARNLSTSGAEVLVNISNDGYLGRTAVMRQHLANAIFRAAENGRPLLRVTNTGLTAKIDSRGRIEDITNGFQSDVRVWETHSVARPRTFYTKYGDVFIAFCGLMSAIVIALSFKGVSER